MHSAEKVPRNGKPPLASTIHRVPGLESVLSGYRRRNYSDKGDRLPPDRPVLGSIGNTLVTQIEALPEPRVNGNSRPIPMDLDCKPRKYASRHLQKQSAQGLNAHSTCTLPASNINQASNSYTCASHVIPEVTCNVAHVPSVEPVHDSVVASSGRTNPAPASTHLVSDPRKRGPASIDSLDPTLVSPELRKHPSKKYIRCRSRTTKSHDRQPRSTTCVSQDCSNQSDRPTRARRLDGMVSHRPASHERALFQVSDANARVSEEKKAPLLPIDITSLPAKVYDTPHGTVSIIDQPRELIVDLRKSEKAAGRPGNEILRISEDGMTVCT